MGNSSISRRNTSRQTNLGYLRNALLFLSSANPLVGQSRDRSVVMMAFFYGNSNKVRRYGRRPRKRDYIMRFRMQKATYAIFGRPPKPIAIGQRQLRCRARFRHPLSGLRRRLRKPPLATWVLSMGAFALSANRPPMCRPFGMRRYPSNLAAEHSGLRPPRF